MDRNRAVGLAEVNMGPVADVGSPRKAMNTILAEYRQGWTGVLRVLSQSFMFAEA